MKETVIPPTADRETAAREMLSALRLLAIQGHLQNGRERIERWQDALNRGEPGLGRLAAIRGLLDEFSGSYFELGEVRSLVERIEQIATGSRTESGIEPGGSAYLTPGDLATVLDGLDQAADELRSRAGMCNDCDASATGLCTTCEGRLARADDFDSLYSRLGGAL